MLPRIAMYLLLPAAESLGTRCRAAACLLVDHVKLGTIPEVEASLLLERQPSRAWAPLINLFSESPSESSVPSADSRDGCVHLKLRRSWMQAVMKQEQEALGWNMH
ncbi:hypothetical protein BDP55DRAFT_246451 [Colletotrichum godetiae]|uniref:Uncharacterized protein n=1 Tax=Colletotrichum godetiae TaxID=1209918 RepID=A0AAJ0AG02_9PEZI|nr:uncharacterized protein BDP55DRAFT_246451 [Colletotrichum godetiae]KAK1672539.1 hypothetical protein BDP55DRAFT_246451 [Colletotrichum godetiae]